MRALLVVNPAATTTSVRTREVLTHALASELKLEVAATEYRGHARELARRAAEQGSVEAVIALGGDGTVNEVVNGLLEHGPDPDRLPRLAVVPGGSTNVFARALGMPNDVVEATGALLDALRTGSERLIGLGHAAGPADSRDAEVPARWFTFCAGLGFDAGVVGRVEAQRARGKRSTHALYVRQTLRQFLGDPQRSRGTITVERPGEEPVTGLVMTIVCNTNPWTYLGNRPVYPVPGTSFDSALDVMGLTSLSPAALTRYGTQLLRSTPERGVHGRHALSLHDVPRFTLRCAQPLPFQLDGDHLGVRTAVTFSGVARALRVIV
ncbi:diacylglycerol/lipid kinase family protein [Streptomyces aidingensis]|uniref:Diacylglycerol kinase family enzyme n=1 Tax=Streptomyces aidingensis TaxID=910347 RepID=A0A1I1RUQ2_9ACTN|nr:diacylglycerol kinase family protein [Streptomyces aidingensis]SFD35263.1 Diacylglycerol kinase family enzyme [Streptomyces aidingensis]